MEMDEVVVGYNVNVLKFQDLFWYDEGHASTLAATWDKVVEEEIRDLKDKELDVVTLENKVLRDYEQEILHDWQSLYPKTSTVAVKPPTHPQ